MLPSEPKRGVESTKTCDNLIRGMKDGQWPLCTFWTHNGRNAHEIAIDRGTLGTDRFDSEESDGEVVELSNTIVEVSLKETTTMELLWDYTIMSLWTLPN